ncbi:NAD(P)/FAD-dependent oxidoreductase [Agrococcus sp. Marseille-P2731]|uniref:NAD(P)/FAD-dependent oxidoreductase n=1 Tax=Agrococcus sp. Marseille-P2731 TaxID=1841862 RepID=UPI0009FB33E8|nr:FAD-binding oxidoreductase [Agrococcus sp. Marseille-P2731]
MTAAGPASSLHVAVVGAGFVGTTLADALVARGCRVTLVDQSGDVAGATSTTFAWLNSHRKRPESYQALNRRGLDVWRGRFGDRHAAHVTWGGHAVIVARAEHVETLRERVVHLRSLGYPASFVPVAGAAERVPGAVSPGAIAAEFPLEGHCDPGPIRASLLAGLAASGACTVVTDAAVAVDGAGVALRSGGRVDADRVVLAAGNGSEALAASAGFRLPLVGPQAGGAAWGFLARIVVPSHGIDRVLSTDDVNIRPDGPDALVAQCLDLDRAAGPDHQHDPEIAAAFASRVMHLLQRDDATVASVRVGHRVIPADGQTVAGPLDGTPDARTWAVVTHSGITLAPLLAELIAGELCGGEPSPLLDGFRPGRFAAGGRQSEGVAPARRPGEQ